MSAGFDWAGLDLSIAGLAAHYARGDFTPAALLAELDRRARAHADHCIWIERLDAAALAPCLERLARCPPADLPLWGVPFAIKDNIDLAGVPTTAACPDVARVPEESATAVALLVAAGAIPLGKTNLDQFATGLVGTRSPYGECRNAFNPAHVSGGSSAGSAVAVALGLASFALGTDTAGSGRVPAAFNNLLGVKPTRGIVSARGVVPACRTLDCVTVFALCADDAARLLDVVVAPDPLDPWSRPNPYANGPRHDGRWAGPFRFGVPPRAQLDFDGDAAAADLYDAAIARLCAAGGEPVTLDYAPLLEAARLLYEGPWVAERYAAIEPLIAARPQALLPVIREIVGGATRHTAVAAFQATYRLQALRLQAQALLAQADVLVAPTAPTCPTRDAVRAAPIAANSALGRYTNFVNLLDLAALALPAGFLPAGPGWGITLFAEAFSDRRLLAIGRRYLEHVAHAPGVAARCRFTADAPPAPDVRRIPVVCCGAHLAGLPLNWQLVERGGVLEATTRSAAGYRLYALADGRRPALVRDATSGASVEVEVWSLPAAEFGGFVASVPPPLGIGQVALADGRSLPGFIAEPGALAGATDITGFGGWRAWLAR